MKLCVKKGDTVVVLTGKDRGKKGKIIAASPEDGRVRVENVNMLSKHKKPRSAQDAGGVIKMEGSLDVSNVQIICPSCGKRTRIAHSTDENGKKFRQCKKCNASLDVKAEKSKKSKKDKDDKKKSESKANAEEKTEKVKKTAKKSGTTENTESSADKE